MELETIFKQIEKSTIKVDAHYAEASVGQFGHFLIIEHGDDNLAWLLLNLLNVPACEEVYENREDGGDMVGYVKIGHDLYAADRGSGIAIFTETMDWSDDV